MDTLNIDLLRLQKKRHKKKKIVACLLTIIFLISGSAFASFKMFYAPKEFKSEVSFLRGLSHLILSADIDFMGGKRNLNILILGMGGAGHEGPYLADTLLIASLDKAEQKFALTSIPRDLLVETNRYGKQKINHLNSYAEIEKPGSGAKYTRDALEKILQFPIDYYVRVDFNGFKKIIDAAGGIDVNVLNSFTDPLFPRMAVSANDSQTTTVSFQKGLQRMNGKTALTYARSRHGNNGEGSDFARNKRQQQLILALKNKIMTKEFLSSPSNLKQLVKSLKECVDTNINAWEAMQLAKTYANLDIAGDRIAVNVLTNGPTGPLYSAYHNNQYVLLPKKSDWSDVRRIIASPFEQKIKNYTGDYANPNAVSLVILNGTGVGGLAAIAAASLEEFGYRVKSVDNAPERNFEKNVIYSIAEGEKQDALQQLKKILDANVAQTTPDWLKNFTEGSGRPDFVIVTGQSSA